MKQMSFADSEYAGKRKQTRKELFLIESTGSGLAFCTGAKQLQNIKCKTWPLLLLSIFRVRCVVVSVFHRMFKTKTAICHVFSIKAELILCK